MPFKMRDTRVATVVVAEDSSGDYTDIQSALDSLPATGGVVYIKEGTYTITAAITIPHSNIAIIGAGKSSIITTTTPNIDILYVIMHDQILIKNLYLYGSGAGTGKGIRFYSGVTNSVIENCYIENCGDYAIKFQTGCNNNIISENDINSNGGGIYFTSICHYNKINKNDINSNIQYGIYLYSICYNNLIIENVVKDNDVNDTTTYDGIRLYLACSYNIITNNRCEDNDRYEINISSANCDKNLVHGNICIGTDHVGTINDVGTGTVIADNIFI